jgi:hypothetical protein
MELIPIDHSSEGNHTINQISLSSLKKVLKAAVNDSCAKRKPYEIDEPI